MSWVRSPLAAPSCTGPGAPGKSILTSPVSPESSQKVMDAVAAAMRKAGLRPFEPRRGLRNGHLQTIVGNYLPRPRFHSTAVAETVEVDPTDGSRVVCFCD